MFLCLCSSLVSSAAADGACAVRLPPVHRYEAPYGLTARGVAQAAGHPDIEAMLR